MRPLGMSGAIWTFTLVVIEATCALCTMGSYASLSVRLSVRLAGLDQNSDCTIFNNSYLGKYCSQEFKTLPHYSTLLGAFEKNTDYTLERIILVDIWT